MMGRARELIGHHTCCTRHEPRQEAEGAVRGRARAALPRSYDQIIRWHWQKAGSIERFHDELKNGLGAGTPPCAELGADAAWYRLNVLTYNTLAALNKRLLPPAAQTIKAKRLRFIAVNLAARITRHARTPCSHVKAALLDNLAVLETRLELRLLRPKLPRGHRYAPGALA
jgi:hypothetical protein